MGVVSHTPGPWLAASHPSSVGGLPIVGQQGRSIASVTFFHLGAAFEKHDAESRANARLIAAAPDLLAALRDFLAEADAGHVSVDTDRRARAAILKSTETPNG